MFDVFIKNNCILFYVQELWTKMITLRFCVKPVEANAVDFEKGS